MARQTQQVKDKEIRDLLESTISRMVCFSPLYGTIFMYVHKVETYSMPTMAVGSKDGVDISLFYNPDFIRRITSGKAENSDPLTAVLKHEALHLLLHHIERQKHYNYSGRGYNIAADLAINSHISGLPEGCIYAKQFELPDHQSSEWYYEALKKKAEEDGMSLEEMIIKFGYDTIDDHSMWGSCESDIIKEKIRALAKKAIEAQESRGWGSESGNLVQQIIAANKPVVNWKTELRYFIEQFIRIGRVSTRMRPNRRFGYINPGSKRDYRARLLVAIDTSGSVPDEELQEFLTEVNGMINHIQVDLIQFDTEIHGEVQEFTTKIKRFTFQGRGGTNFRPPIEFADQGKYNGLIMLTDGYCDYPPKPKCRVMWALTKAGEGNKPPYGKKVVIKAKGK